MALRKNFTGLSVTILSRLYRLCDQGISSVVYIAHSMNWEYITSLPLHFGPTVQFGQIYHPLENKFFDKAFIDLRERFGSTSIPMAHTLRRIVEYHREKRCFVIGFLADQVPTWEARWRKCPKMLHRPRSFT